MSFTGHDHGDTGKDLPLVPTTNSTMLRQVVSASPLNSTVKPSQSQKGWFATKSPQEIEAEKLYNLYVDAEKVTGECTKEVKMKEDTIMSKRNATATNNRAIEVTKTQVLQDMTQESEAMIEQAKLERTQKEGTVTKEYGPEYTEKMATIDKEAKRQSQVSTASSTEAYKRSAGILGGFEKKQKQLQGEIQEAFEAYNESLTKLEEAQDKEKAAARDWAETVNQNTLTALKKALQDSAAILQMANFTRSEQMREVFAKTDGILHTVGGLTAAEFGQQPQASVYIPMASTESVEKKRKRNALAPVDESVDASVNAPVVEPASNDNGGGRGRGRGRGR